MSYDPTDEERPKKKGDGLGMFDPKVLARIGDPKTSHEAAREIVPILTVLQAWALKLVKKYPRCTVSEVSEAEDLRDPRKYGRRLNELLAKGLILEGGVRRCSISRRHCTVYLATDS